MPVRLPSLSALIAAILPVFAVACTTSTTTTDTTNSEDASGTSRLKLLPTSFLGDTPCSAAPGAMRSYVATLHMADAEDVALVTSPPVPCGVGVLFESYLYDPDGDGQSGIETINTERQYTISVQGFEAFAADLDLSAKPAPVGRWSAACGSKDAPILPRDDGATLVEDCTLLVDAKAGSTVTAVTIDPRAALGTLACAGEGAPGQQTVAAFDIQSNDGLGDTLGLPCSSAVEPIVISGSKLKDGATVSFYVAAHAAKDGPVAWGAMCSAVVEAGLTVTAACTPLTSEGGVLIDLASVLAPFDIVCGGDFSSCDVVVTSGEQTTKASGITCGAPSAISPVAQGPYELTLTVPGKDGKPVFSAKCEGSVDPGRSTAPTSCVQQ